MPLGKSVSKNISELYKDNKKSGKSKGAEGKARSRDQIIAIAYSAAEKESKAHERRKGDKKEDRKNKEKIS